MSQPPVTSDDVSRLFRGLGAEQIAEIIATGASVAELEQVAAVIDQMNDVMGEMERPLAGAAARVYDVLMADPRFAGDNHDR